MESADELSHFYTGRDNSEIPTIYPIPLSNFMVKILVADF